ncbi:hypothetical protein RNJ44_03422 [Nakaseomyces bracarensis]|uniref:Cytidyltransferase-like domain-containing protein n=1 Tax=Nakaseomyces bracarensis TaxID=273131 RepID=A0ABR4NX26_9SACH
MVKIAIVLKDLSRLNFEQLHSAVLDNILKPKLVKNCALDVILVDKFEDSMYLDDVLGRLYSMCREVLLERELSLEPVNILFGDEWNMSSHRSDYVWDYLVAEETFSVTGYRYKNHIAYPKLDPVDNHIPSSGKRDINKFEVTALGGTFDHLHDGHKILLSVAAFLTSKRLIVGVTDQELLANKKYKEYMESFDTRCIGVQSFLQLLKPSLKMEPVAIRDVCGPTGTVPEIKCLVVSRETVGGGKVVNETRASKGMDPLDIYIVNVLGGQEDDGWKEKLSSTEIRKSLATS